VPVSITESRDQLGHGPRIRRALRNSTLPDLAQLTGLGAESYSDVVFERTVARIRELRPAIDEEGVLTKLNVLSHEHSVAHPKYGVDSATIRALLMLSLVEHELGPLAGMEVVEIGGGIASFAATAMLLSRPRRFTIYDLPDMLEIQKRYLKSVLPSDEFDRVEFQNAYDLTTRGPYDLVYSTYAFSELEYGIALDYFDKVVRPARMGFMTYNHVGKQSHVRNMELIDFCSRLLSGERPVSSIEVRREERHKDEKAGVRACCNVLWRRPSARDLGARPRPNLSD
jgi:hypothetical protein